MLSHRDLHVVMLLIIRAIPLLPVPEQPFPVWIFSQLVLPGTMATFFQTAESSVRCCCKVYSAWLLKTGTLGPLNGADDHATESAKASPLDCVTVGVGGGNGDVSNGVWIVVGVPHIFSTGSPTHARTDTVRGVTPT